jgi:hypothetical protein
MKSIRSIRLDFAASWVDVPTEAGDPYFLHYPDESIAVWHQRLGLN